MKAIIVDPSAGIWAENWPDLLAQAGMTALATGGVLFYKVRPQVLVSFRNATADQMAEREARAAGRSGAMRLHSVAQRSKLSHGSLCRDGMGQACRD